MAARKAADALDPLALASAIGLDKAVNEFPRDVEIAAQSALSARKAAGAIELLNAEPWPPMQIRKCK